MKKGIPMTQTLEDTLGTRIRGVAGSGGGIVRGWASWAIPRDKNIDVEVQKVAEDILQFFSKYDKMSETNSTFCAESITWFGI
mmetsp:Transcript_23555/g.53752  ORF Transcript_23555/g.53752 Transcript_23555/m.53752 type:complete len:83 (+) Transcript_23555:1829-2077(+)